MKKLTKLDLVILIDGEDVDSIVGLILMKI